MIPLFAIFSISLRKTQAQGQFNSRFLALASYPGETYTIGDQFGSNLDNVLINLVYDTPSTGMNVSSYGDFPNSVYGFLQCRGDASQKECHDCCQTVMPNVSLWCTNSIECILWLPMCELHYRNGSFISDFLVDMVTSDSQMDVQGMALRDLVSNLSGIASTSAKRFAEGATEIYPPPIALTASRMQRDCLNIILQEFIWLAAMSCFPLLLQQYHPILHPIVRYQPIVQKSHHA